MIYYTGDIHGSKYEVTRFCKRMNLTRNDVVVILGDVGANYYGNDQDTVFKHALSSLKPTILCIHGNHERRPATIPTYELREWNGGQVWVEPQFPKLLFAKDGEIYTIEGIRHLVIGGAYSVDKFYRLRRGYAWWPDEQPSDEIKSYVESQIKTQPVDVILSHTCPFKYEPVEAFLPMVDQSTVDTSTEKWLDTIEESCEYKQWLCGHWHINKRMDKMQFLFHDFISSDEIIRRMNDK